MDDHTPTRLGKYELIARIGNGGMAEVHLARMRGPMNFEKLVVVKTIHPQLASQEEFLRMLFDEARLSALIRHPAVVDIYELGRAGDAYFIAMEYLDGQALSTVIAAGAKGFVLDPFAATRVVADAAAGLHAAHELRTSSGKLFELVHRDISPGNIMVQYDGTVKIVDFGVAKARGRLTTSAGHQLKGKLGYASPEQLAAKRVDRRSDIFSLGVVLWEVLCNRRLFPGDDTASAITRATGATVVPPSTYSPQVPPPLDDVVMRALAVRPEDRFQNALEMKQALEDVLRSLGSHRERDTIVAYMMGTFSRRRDERAQLLRRRRADTESEFALPDDAGHFEQSEVEPPVVVATGSRPSGPRSVSVPSPTADSSQMVVVRTSEPSGLRTAGQRPWASRHRFALSGTVLLLLAAGATYALSGGAGGERASARSTRRTVASERVAVGAKLPAAPELKPAAVKPPPVEGPVPPEPEAEPEAEAAEDAPGDAPTASPKATGSSKPGKSAAELDREGADLFVRGNALEAKQRFKQAIAIDPHRPSSYRGLGLAYQALGKRDQAVTAFQKYLKLSPNAPDAAAIRARLEKLGP